MSFATLAVTYLVGGVTLLPLLVIAFVYLHPKREEAAKELPFLAGEVEEYAQTGLDCFKQGWVFVTHEDLESQDEISLKTESVAESLEVKSAYSSLYKLVTNSKGTTGGSLDLGVPDGFAATSTVPAASVNAALAAAPPAAGKPSAAAKKHRYYGVLKHGNLFLYKNEKLQDVKHVIVLSGHVVALWPRTLSEASLFTKYSLIAIIKSDWSRARRLSDTVTGSEWSHGLRISVRDVLRRESGLPAPPGTIFVHTDLNIEKEDWYFALLRATKTDAAWPPGLSPTVHARTMHLETHSMVSLIQGLYCSEGQLQSKWFNAIVGRVFLSLQNTDHMREYLTAKIERKLNKMKTPGFLDKFLIRKVEAGSAAPTVTFPVLKEINPQGDILVGLHVHYAGGMLIQIATKANINLGSRFKTREVDVLLSVTLERILGPMLVRIKAPPSARVWYAYEREPDMAIKIEPVISSRQMSYNIITNTIEKRFKDAIRESIVLPHWDDLVFCHTPDALYRGGIWDPHPAAKESDVRDEDSGDSVAKEGGAETPSDTFSADSALTVTESSEEQKLDSLLLVDSAPSRSQKAKVSKTISDISKRMRKPKSGHTLGVDGTHCLSDGSVIEATRQPPAYEEHVQMSSIHDSPQSLSTLRKLGEWYSKSDRTGAPSSPADSYHPPEMITNRRTRKQSSATANSDVTRATDGSLYDFGKEIDENRMPSQPIDLMRVPSVKAGAPILSPKELKATAITEPTSRSYDSADKTFGDFLTSQSAQQHSKKEKAPDTTENPTEDPLPEGFSHSLATSQLPVARVNTIARRKPPPEMCDDNEMPTAASPPS